ncbi:hypothetical protein C1645_864996 [Glomus cerebriforme]|uniref:RRM domain-containing protein n=1 Tax=Glomus cerebriforme TaxID=658196 RepID=A0A397S5Y1_9GLOM|nr:hypothetical protein C1645_864996 [Glomus cerebriforme]
MSPNKHNQIRKQQPHRSVKEVKSPVPKSLTTSQVKETTFLDKDKEIITQTYGTSFNPASDEQQHSEQQRSSKRPRQQDQPDNVLSDNNTTSSSSTSSPPRDQDQDDTSTSVTNSIMITTARRTNHYTIAPYDDVKGNAPRSKIQNLTKIFAKFSTYTGAAVRIIKKLNKGKYMCIFFLDEKDLLDAIKLLITKSSKASPPVNENSNNNATSDDHLDQPNPDSVTSPQFYFTKFSDAVSADDLHVKDDTNQRTVQIIDIPLVRVFPKFLTNEQRQLRKNFGCKLTGLPNNIQARDLHDILRATNAKSVFIPRNPVSYKPLNFAYINYESEDAKQNAIKTNYKLNGRDLFWCTENARTCNRCDDKSHDHNPSAKANSDNSQRPHKSQQSRTTSSSSNLNDGTQRGGSMHGAQTEKFTAMYNEVLKLMEQINSCLFSIDKKIFMLEKYTSKKPESLSPHVRELRVKNSNIPSVPAPVIENTASSSSSLTEFQENPVDIEALKKESSETRSLTNTCVNILKQMQSNMGMDNPDDADPENFEDYDHDDDEDDNMDEGEFDKEGYLLNPTDDALNKLTENWGN